MDDRPNQVGSNSPETAEALLWNKRRTANALSISVRHLEDLTSEGVIKAVRLGRRSLYDPADLRAAIEALKNASAVEQSRRKQNGGKDAA